MNKEDKHRFLLMTAGIFMFFAAASIPVLIFTNDRLRCEMGLFTGSVMSVLMLWHMNFSINKSLYMEKHQSAFLALNSAGRLIVVAGVLAAAAMTEFVNAVFMVVGLLGLKFAAYVYPLMERKNRR